MGKKDIDLTAQRIAAIASIKTVIEDLATAFQGKEHEINMNLTSAKIEVEKIMDEVEKAEAKVVKYKKRLKGFKEFEKDLAEREVRIKTTEDLLEKEKKLATSKKQHLIEWEKELTEKARRLNG
jgi:hypothetical protein